MYFVFTIIINIIILVYMPDDWIAINLTEIIIPLYIKFISQPLNYSYIEKPSNILLIFHAVQVIPCYGDRTMCPFMI